MTGLIDERPLVREPRVRRRVVAAVAATVGLVLIIVLAVVGYHWRHSSGPTAFLPTDGVINQSTEAQPDVPTWIGMTYQIPRNPDLVVHIDTIEARVGVDTANAQISFYICSNIQTPGPGTVMLGSDSGEVPDMCSKLVPARNVDMVLGRHHFENIVMKVVATHPGNVRVNGIDVTYSAAGQQGTQWTGEGVVVQVRGQTAGT